MAAAPPWFVAICDRVWPSLVGTGVSFRGYLVWFRETTDTEFSKTALDPAGREAQPDALVDLLAAGGR